MLSIPYTFSPLTIAASRIFFLGRINPSNPFRFASIAIGNAPLIAFKLPSKESSPMIKYVESFSDGICSLAAKIPIAIVRSYADPSLRISAGAIFTTIFILGITKPTCFKADSILRLLSFTALSGKPTK